LVNNLGQARWRSTLLESNKLGHVFAPSPLTLYWPESSPKNGVAVALIKAYAEGGVERLPRKNDRCVGCRILNFGFSMWIFI